VFTEVMGWGGKQIRRGGKEEVGEERQDPLQCYECNDKA